MIEKIFSKVFKNKVLLKMARPFTPVYYLFRFFQSLLFYKLLKNNIVLKDLHKSKKAFVFATGVSIADVRLSFFHDELTFCCNNIYRHPEFKCFYPSYYLAMDPLHVWSSTDIPCEKPDFVLSKIDQLLKDCETTFFFHISMRQLIKKRKYLAEKKVFYMIPRSKKMAMKLAQLDLDKPNDLMLGTVYMMIGSAIYTGVSEIYLFGLGYTYKPMQHFHFYDDYKSEQSKKLQKELENNSIDERHYILKNIAEKKGIKIFNVVPDGFESPIYETVRLKDVYSMLEDKSEK